MKNQMKKTSQQGNVLIILVVLVVLAIGGYLLLTKLQQGGIFPKTTVNPKPTPQAINLKEGRKLPPAQVKITKTGFVPATVKIKAGQSVTWTNEDSTSHQLTSDAKLKQDSLSETEPIQAKEVMTFPFTTPGTITYKDQSNSSFKGVIIVK